MENGSPTPLPVLLGGLTTPEDMSSICRMDTGGELESNPSIMPRMSPFIVDWLVFIQNAGDVAGMEKLGAFEANPLLVAMLAEAK